MVRRDKSEAVDDQAYRLRRDYQLRRDFGISIDEYHLILDSQHGVCAICKTEPDDTYHVDHNHVTNQVRGVLCARCNLLLGHAKDSSEILRMAIHYLEKREQISDIEFCDDLEIGELING